MKKIIRSNTINKFPFFFFHAVSPLSEKGTFVICFASLLSLITLMTRSAGCPPVADQNNTSKQNYFYENRKLKQHCWVNSPCVNGVAVVKWESAKSTQQDGAASKKKEKEKKTLCFLVLGGFKVQFKERFFNFVGYPI